MIAAVDATDVWITGQGQPLGVLLELFAKIPGRVLVAREDQDFLALEFTGEEVLQRKELGILLHEGLASPTFKLTPLVAELLLAVGLHRVGRQAEALDLADNVLIQTAPNCIEAVGRSLQFTIRESDRLALDRRVGIRHPNVRACVA